MIYNAGTISLSGNTATGAGTNWTAPASQIRTGQTIIVLSNPVQLFQITAINSATSLTVTPAAVAALNGQKYGILVTDSLSVDGLAQSISQLINEYDENIGAWESFASTTANQNVTVTINGQSISIPALGKLVQKGANGAVPVTQGGTGATNAQDARTNLGLGDSATRSIGNTANTVAAGDDSRLNSIDGKRGGALADHDQLILQSTPTDNSQGSAAYTPELRGRINGRGGYIDPKGIIWSAGLKDTIGGTAFLYLQISGYAQTKAWTFDIITGNATAPGSWVPNSDSRLKDKITKVTDPLRAMRMMNGYTWTRLDNGQWGIGFIAQEVAKAFPEAVHEGEDRKMPDGTVVEKVLSPDTYGVAAALHHEAILALMEKIDNLETKIEQLTDEKNQQDAQSS